MDKRSSINKRRIFIAAGMLIGANLAIFPSCETVATTVNPCGTIFGFCDPTDVDLFFADVPDYALDPSCSIPYFGLDQGQGTGGAGQAGTCATVPVFANTPGARP